MLFASLPWFIRMPPFTDQPSGREGSWPSHPETSLPLKRSMGLPGFLLGGFEGHTGPRTPVHVSLPPRVSAVPTRRARFIVARQICWVTFGALPCGYSNRSSPFSMATTDKSKTAPPPELKRPLSMPPSRVSSSQQNLCPPALGPFAVISHRPRYRSGSPGLAQTPICSAAKINANSRIPLTPSDRIVVPPNCAYPRKMIIRCDFDLEAGGNNLVYV